MVASWSRKWQTKHGRLSQVRRFGQPVSATHPHLVQDGEVTPGFSRQEFALRRHKLMEKISQATSSLTAGLDSNHLVIIPSATKVYMTHDIPYTFRQNTDFLYLCGFQEPDSVLVLSGGHSHLPDHTATLFVPKKDVHKELWEGSRSGRSGAVELTGVDRAENTEDLPDFLSLFLKGNTNCVLWYNDRKSAHPAFHNEYICQVLKDCSLVENPTPLVQDLRLVKSRAETDIMTQSNEIASEAFTEVMRFSQPGVNEAHLYAKMDFECRMRDAEYLAYPPVVAGGNRANTIHYISNNQLVEEGDMVLMDAGCEYHGYASDITRTWPVSGRFSDPQRVLYEVVLEVQTHCIEMCERRSVTLNQIFQEMLSQLGEKLKSAGVIPHTVEGAELHNLVRALCPHHVGHYLGMDVHDTDGISRTQLLSPGVVVTIEPGVYVPYKMSGVPSDFHGNGLRIEDNILITDSGYTNLTANCPKDPETIEAIVKGF